MFPAHYIWLTAAMAIDKTRAQIGICRGVVVTSKTDDQLNSKSMGLLAATKLIANMPKYHDEGTGR